MKRERKRERERAGGIEGERYRREIQVKGICDEKGNERKRGRHNGKLR